MWKLRHLGACQGEDTNEHTPPTPNNKHICSVSHMNKLIHAQIESLTTKRDYATQDYDELNLNEQISAIEPQLWNAVQSLTKSKSDGTSKVTDPSSPAYNAKKVRCFFLLCIIMFITDDRCSMPMHMLITDLIESQGGSSVLIKVLNRLGVCSSSDTLARFIQQKRTVMEYHCLKNMCKDAFTVVSADNLDFLHSFTRVFCGKQTSS